MGERCRPDQQPSRERGSVCKRKTPAIGTSPAGWMAFLSLRPRQPVSWWEVTPSLGCTRGPEQKRPKTAPPHRPYSCAAGLYGYTNTKLPQRALFMRCEPGARPQSHGEAGARSLATRGALRRPMRAVHRTAARWLLWRRRASGMCREQSGTRGLRAGVRCSSSSYVRPVAARRLLMVSGVIEYRATVMPARRVARSGEASACATTNASATALGGSRSSGVSCSALCR